MELKNLSESLDNTIQNRKPYPIGVKHNLSPHTTQKSWSKYLWLICSPVMDNLEVT